MPTLKQPELYSVGSIMRAVSGMTPTEAQAQLGELERKWPHVPWRVMAAQPPPDEWSQLVKGGFAYRAMWRQYAPGAGFWCRFEIANLKGSGNRVYIRSFSFYDRAGQDAIASYGARLQVAAAAAVAPDGLANLLAAPLSPALDTTKTRVNAIPNGGSDNYGGFLVGQGGGANERRLGTPYLAVLDDPGSGAAADAVFDVIDANAAADECMCEIEFAVVPLTTA